MAAEDIAILLGGEELPTSEKLRLLTVEILSREERERIRSLQEKVEELLASGGLGPDAASRLDIVFASLEKIAERIDSIRKPYDLELATEDFRHRLSSVVQELDASSAAASRKLDSSMQRFDSKSSAVMDSISSLAHVKSDVQGLRNLLDSLGQKVDALGRLEASFDVLKEEVEMSVGDAAAKLRPHADSIASAASEMYAAKSGLADMGKELKESNVKLSILIDSVEQKVFELSAIFENVGKIEKGIESQTESLKGVATFLKEFMAHAEQRSARLDNALADFSAFTDRMDAEMRKALDLIDERSGMLDVAARELSGLRSQMDAKFEELDSTKSEISDAVYAISRDAPLMEKAAADILDAHSLVSGSAERLEASADELGKMAQQSGDFLASQRSAASELKSAAAAAEKAMKALRETQDSLRETSRSVDRKTDDILNVLLRKAGELAKANETLEKIVEKISSVPQVKAARPRKKARRKAAGTRTARRTKPRPRKAARRRSRKPARNIRAENEALDLLILNSLKNVSMNMAMLEEATNTGEARLRKRLAVLTARGVVAREKRGRAVFYSSRVETVA